MQTLRLGFIGGGNMSRSLVGGLLKNAWPASTLHIADPDPTQRARIEALDPALHVDADGPRVVANVDVVVLAVKPQVLQAVARAIRSEVQARRPLIISIAAGIKSADIERWLGGDLAIVRCMPNTPALVMSGATGLFANLSTSQGQREIAERLMRSVGVTVWVNDERQLDAVTALSGSGPAYVFLVLEALQHGAESLGLAPEAARLLALQTVAGAAKLALESDEPPALLRERVTSKGGTTERALAEFNAGDLIGLFTRAMHAAAARSEELAEVLGTDAA
ncbi:MAG: pyrroline-5-carboxylate reductase [Thiotrichales bacterium]